MIHQNLQTSGRWRLPGGKLLCRGESQCRPGRYRCCLLLCIVWVCIFLCGCEKDPPLRIGLNPWPGYQYLHLAEERGYFIEEGVRVRLLQFNSLGDTRRAFERRQIDGMCCTLAEVLTTYRHSNRKPKVVLVVDYSDGADVIIAREPINRVEDLRGRVVAAQPGTVDSLLLSRALQRAGLQLDAIQLRPMATPNMATAFAQGEIHAAVTFAPLAHDLMSQPGAKVIFTSKAIPREIMDVLAAGADVIPSRRTDFLAVCRAVDRAMQFAEEHPQEASRIMAKHSGSAPEVFSASLEGVRMVRRKEQSLYFAPGGALNQAIDGTAAALRASGLITGPVQPSTMIVDLAAQPPE